MSTSILYYATVILWVIQRFKLENNMNWLPTATAKTALVFFIWASSPNKEIK